MTLWFDFLVYPWNLLALRLAGEIHWATVRWALVTRPTAVAGMHGSFIVDPAFDRGWEGR